ncbi:hypothetical protein OESDEN_15921 [Oesophagostomum dentatum]|uniref:Tc1-like transposase DDE domain-containing protein n=1 Tax=Oesophagostomum dentatum TaxID=61180 RepID=A0A0B1SGB0_OESDE|nr:hypothetical protein OESDEN_15921 [Oesophagostomum dentatum]
MPLVRYSNIIRPMHREGKSFAAIHKELLKLNSEITYYQVRKFFQESHSRKVPPKPKICHRRSLALQIGTIESILRDTYRADSSATVNFTLQRLSLRNVSVSPSHLRTIRRNIGLRRNSTKYCHMIRDVNKEKRVEFCMRMIENHEDFADCIFTDESIVQIGNSVKHCFNFPGDYYARLRSRAKHSVKLHLWGGISRRGATELAVFPGRIRIDSQNYCKILERCFVRFNNSAYHGYGKLVQDNAPAHKSAYTTRKLEEWNLRVLDWPPESPDLNPIERKKMKNVNELTDAVLEFWKTLTPEVCERYINGIHGRMEKVIEQGGRNIKE